MRTIVYVDGFNLYYRLLKSRPHLKWLDQVELPRQILHQQNVITKVRYFTANVSGRFDPGAPLRQNTYFEALASLPLLQIHFGTFLVKKTWAGLVPPDLNPLKPNAKPPFLPWPDVVRIFRTEEKGSDVNLATYLLIDAFKDEFDVAAIITNDTDLIEPIRFVSQDMKKVVGLLTPVPKPAVSLVKYASFVHHIRDQHLAAAQLPDPVMIGTKAVNKPATWI